ncbi:MAG TPA: hypothetical protein VIM69_00500 [Opitutaceae bacterium]
MKNFFLTATMAAILVGCAQARPIPLSNLVGPASELPSSGPAGTLVVYSAYETQASAASPFDDVRPYTSYKLYSEKGELLQKIDNSNTGLGDTPTSVRLAPGIYHIVALSNGHGLVEVPVRVEDNQVTAVHLDSEGPAIRNKKLAIRLSSGEVVGWSGAE